MEVRRGQGHMQASLNRFFNINNMLANHDLI